MLRYAGRRLLVGIPLLLVVPLLVFLLIDLAPGDPAVVLAGDQPTPERIEAIREQLNLNGSVLERYFDWVVAALQGDLGQSFVTNEAVTDLLVRRMGTTMSLVLFAMVMAVLLGVAMAIVASLRPGGLVDRLVNWLASIAIAIPAFWFGLVLASVFAVSLQLLPTFGFEPLSAGFWPWLSHLILPGIALGLLPAAEVTLQLRSALGQVLKSDYILNAQAKGMSRSSILFKHSLKNASVPVVTVLGFRVAEVLAGSVTIEVIYNMPGLGSLAVDSVLSRDIPVLLGFVLFSTAVVVVVNLLVDISYGYFNPKVRT
ncbi:ABC transporter permease [Micromonospora sonneratiae]|jgi:peptide/nickel transport system permease protein|uniref:ABC transporter permease n=1 Tax=Micromonospora sonneratiae TaxID=1184706 RepID=A0ABW3Y5L1_9ACTN